MLLVALVVLIVGIVAALLFGMQGPPYVPTDDETAAQMLALIKSYRPGRILDMGSGDGKLVILLAEKGYQVDGIELNPLLVLRSRRAIKKAGLQDRATIRWGNFWKHNVSGYDVVVLYVIKHIMPRLEQKLYAELPTGAHVISNFFVLPNSQPVKHLKRVYAYKV